eukprot:TRINITY_DN4501_c0_g3_i1.p1 TRINITY_DN4501_c0_g3~~TRINITY_DN4501_c0_g3_i1.p1  ORF type:complete len:557 (+),score=196.91 TRINITY_DN4501_c0_g3_i1:412-2082(+)
MLQAHHYQQELEATKRECEDVESENRKLKNEILFYQLQLGGHSAVQDNDYQISRQTQIMENRILLAQNKIMGITGEIENTKTIIDETRQEILIQKDAADRLEAELESLNTTSLLEDIESKEKMTANVSEKIRLLQKAGEEKCVAFEREWKDVCNEIDDKNVQKEMTPQQKEILDSEEQHMRRMSARLNWKTAIRKVIHHKTQGKVQHFVDTFKQIQRGTGVKNLEEFVQRFQLIEDENFSLFRQVSDLDKEAARLNDQIREMDSESSDLMKQMMLEDNAREKILRSLEGRIQETKQKRNAFDEAFDKQMQTATKIKSIVEGLYRKVVDDGPFMEQRTDDNPSGITEFNLMQVLGAVEQRAQELQKQHTMYYSNIDTPKPQLKPLTAPRPHIPRVDIAPPALPEMGGPRSARIMVAEEENTPSPIDLNKLMDDFHTGKAAAISESAKRRNMRSRDGRPITAASFRPTTAATTGTRRGSITSQLGSTQQSTISQNQSGRHIQIDESSNTTSGLPNTPSRRVNTPGGADKMRRKKSRKVSNFPNNNNKRRKSVQISENS